jgi:PAS domain-containing protein
MSRQALYRRLERLGIKRAQRHARPARPPLAVRFGRAHDHRDRGRDCDDRVCLTLAAVVGRGVGLAVASAAWSRLIWRALAPMRALFRALAGTVASYRDGDFSFGITWDKASDLIELVDAHNALGDALREQRLALVQRELLLDTMVQNTPVAMVLVDAARRIVLGNLAARKLLGEGRRLEGRASTTCWPRRQALRDAFERGGDGIFAVGMTTTRTSTICRDAASASTAARHELVLLRQLTAELRRQEVQTWKKVIRVISHELNNSLAPIASLAHSSAEAAAPRPIGTPARRAGDHRGTRAPPGRLHPRLRALRQAAGAAQNRWNGRVPCPIAQPGRIRARHGRTATASAASMPRRWNRRC